MPDDEFQSHIQMDGKVPVLVIKQVALDQQQRPIEYSISYCRSDLYVLCARSSVSRVGAQSPPRCPTTQLATAFPSSTASASDQPDASPASTPPAWLSPAPMVSTTVVGNAGTKPEDCPLKCHAPSLSWRTTSGAEKRFTHASPKGRVSVASPARSAAMIASRRFRRRWAGRP